MIRSFATYFYIAGGGISTLAQKKYFMHFIKKISIVLFPRLLYLSHLHLLLEIISELPVDDTPPPPLT